MRDNSTFIDNPCFLLCIPLNHLRSLLSLVLFLSVKCTNLNCSERQVQLHTSWTSFSYHLQTNRIQIHMLIYCWKWKCYILLVCLYSSFSQSPPGYIRETKQFIGELQLQHVILNAGIKQTFEWWWLQLTWRCS